MGKKTTKRKTRWRTLSIGEVLSDTEEETQENTIFYKNIKSRYNSDGTNVHKPTGSAGSFHYSQQHRSYSTNSSIVNGDQQLRNNSFSSSSSITNYNSNRSSSTTTNGRGHFLNQSSSHSTPIRNRYHRNNYIASNGTGGTSAGGTSHFSTYYGDKYKSSRSNSTTSEPKITFNEDEYTRITTPRQDVLFKKGYLSRKKTLTTTSGVTSTTSSSSIPSTDANGTSVPHQNEIGLDQDISAPTTNISSAQNGYCLNGGGQNSCGESNPSTGYSSTTGGGTPEHNSLDGGDFYDTDLEPHQPFIFHNGFVDQNGVFYVNGYDTYPMMLIPGLPPPPSTVAHSIATSGQFVSAPAGVEFYQANIPTGPIPQPPPLIHSHEPVVQSNLTNGNSLQLEEVEDDEINPSIGLNNLNGDVNNTVSNELTTDSSKLDSTDSQSELQTSNENDEKNLQKTSNSDTTNNFVSTEQNQKSSLIENHQKQVINEETTDNQPTPSNIQTTIDKITEEKKINMLISETISETKSISEAPVSAEMSTSNEVSSGEFIDENNVDTTTKEDVISNGVIEANTAGFIPQFYPAPPTAFFVGPPPGFIPFPPPQLGQPVYLNEINIQPSRLLNSGFVDYSNKQRYFIQKHRRRKQPYRQQQQNEQEHSDNSDSTGEDIETESKQIMEYNTNNDQITNDLQENVSKTNSALKLDAEEFVPRSLRPINPELRAKFEDYLNRPESNEEFVPKSQNIVASIDDKFTIPTTVKENSEPQNLRKQSQNGLKKRNKFQRQNLCNVTKVENDVQSHVNDIVEKSQVTKPLKENIQTNSKNDKTSTNTTQIVSETIEKHKLKNETVTKSPQSAIKTYKSPTKIIETSATKNYAQIVKKPDKKSPKINKINTQRKNSNPISIPSENLDLKSMSVISRSPPDTNKSVVSSKPITNSSDEWISVSNRKKGKGKIQHISISLPETQLDFKPELESKSIRDEIEKSEINENKGEDGTAEDTTEVALVAETISSTIVKSPVKKQKNKVKPVVKTLLKKPKVVTKQEKTKEVILPVKNDIVNKKSKAKVSKKTQKDANTNGISCNEIGIGESIDKLRKLSTEHSITNLEMSQEMDRIIQQGLYKNLGKTIHDEQFLSIIDTKLDHVLPKLFETAKMQSGHETFDDFNIMETLNECQKLFAYKSHPLRVARKLGPDDDDLMVSNVNENEVPTNLHEPDLSDNEELTKIVSLNSTDPVADPIAAGVDQLPVENSPDPDSWSSHTNHSTATVTENQNLMSNTKTLTDVVKEWLHEKSPDQVLKSPEHLLREQSAPPNLYNTDSSDDEIDFDLLEQPKNVKGNPLFVVSVRSSSVDDLHVNLTNRRVAFKETNKKIPLQMNEIISQQMNNKDLGNCDDLKNNDKEVNLFDQSASLKNCDDIIIQETADLFKHCSDEFSKSSSSIYHSEQQCNNTNNTDKTTEENSYKSILKEKLIITENSSSQTDLKKEFNSTKLDEIIPIKHVNLNRSYRSASVPLTPLKNSDDFSQCTTSKSFTTSTRVEEFWCKEPIPLDNVSKSSSTSQLIANFAREFVNSVNPVVDGLSAAKTTPTTNYCLEVNESTDLTNATLSDDELLCNSHLICNSSTHVNGTFVRDVGIIKRRAYSENGAINVNNNNNNNNFVVNKSKSCTNMNENSLPINYDHSNNKNNDLDWDNDDLNVLNNTKQFVCNAKSDISINKNNLSQLNNDKAVNKLLLVEEIEQYDSLYGKNLDYLEICEKVRNDIEHKSNIGSETIKTNHNHHHNQGSIDPNHCVSPNRGAVCCSIM